MMEHRCGERLELSLPAMLRTPGGGKCRCVVDNLSTGGAFVSLPRNSEMPCGVVELEVWLPYAEPQLCRWRASVVHQQGRGIGLMFDQWPLGDLLPFLAAQKAARRSVPLSPERNVRSRAPVAKV
jgi:hypothetical protein